MKKSSRVKNGRKSRTKRAPASKQTPTVSSASAKPEEKPRAKGGLKLPSADLAELLWLANLVPPKYEFSQLLGDTDELKDAELKLELLLSGDGSRDPAAMNSPEDELVQGLKDSQLMARLLDSLGSKPDLLRAHLLDHMHRPKEWRPIALEEEPRNRVAREYAQVVAVLIRHNQILDARDNLRTLIRGSLPYIPVRHSIASLFVNKNGIVQERITTNPPDDLFSRAVKGIDASYLRECQVCDRMFFARRSTSMVCDPDSTCAGTYSKRQERKNAQIRAEMKARNAVKKGEGKPKKKRAKTASKR